MRNVFLFTVALTVLSCKSGGKAKADVAHNRFSGTWTSVFAPGSGPEGGYRDTLWFNEDSSFSIRMYNDSGLIQQTTGTYRYDTARKALLTSAPAGNKAFFVPPGGRDTLLLIDDSGNQMAVRRIK
ncbi:hypothetical protein [Flaviaesturariibacter terrae]